MFETDSAENVSVAVMIADLPNELVELLEKITLGKS